MESAEIWWAKLVEAIQFQVRHAAYGRALEIRDFAHMVATGAGQEKEVERYRRYEADDLKKQRNRLYNPLTKYAISRPRKQFKKVWRVEGVRRQIASDNSAKLQALNAAMGRFDKGQSLERWLVSTLEFYGVTDPNAWLICERHDEKDAHGNTTSVVPYAFLVPSVGALDFRYSKSGKLEHFLARTIRIENISENGSRVEQVLENYYLYFAGGIIRAREAGKNTEIEQGETEVFIEVLDAGQAGKRRKFYFKAIDNGTTEVPAICAGVYMDEVSGKENVFVPWFDPAEYQLRDLIRTKATNDVVTTLHAYPKRWEFEKECVFSDEERGRCDGGYLGGIRDKDHICPVCKGTGFPANFTTEQASVKLLLPESAEMQNKLLDLSKLSFVEPINTEILSLMDERVRDLERRIMEAVFDTGTYQRPEGTTTRTATEIRAQTEGYSDVLKPFCSLVSRAYELFYRVAAQYMEFGIQVDHEFPEDLQITSLTDEVDIFKEMRDSGVGFEALAAQRGRVLDKVTEGDVTARENIKAKYRHEPFAGKNPEAVAQIIAERSPQDPDRVLWENFEAVFTDIFDERPLFHQMAFAAQKAAVSAKVAEFAARIVMAGSDAQQPLNVPNEPQA